MAATFTQQSEFEMIYDGEAPGLHRFKVRFDANPADPRLLIIKEGKPNLLPDLIGDQTPEIKDWRFDAFYDGARFGWIKSDDLEGQQSTDDVLAFIRALI